MKLKILFPIAVLLTALGLVAATQAQTPDDVTDVLQSNGCPVCNRDGINLSGANLAGANFWSSSLRGANFSGSNLAGANFNEADLTGANLRGANLTGANLKLANLSHADLTGAKLEKADLQNAILFAANLKDTNLQSANVTGVEMPSSITSAPPNSRPARSPLALPFGQSQPPTATASKPTDISSIAKEITVLVKSYKPGSGAIISKEGNTYYVLTAAHVVCPEDFSKCKDDEIKIVTHDGQDYKINLATAKKLPGVDLAVLQFTSTQNYSVARLANSDRLSGVYVSGWPTPNSDSQPQTYQFSPGIIVDHSTGDMAEGYSLFYTNVTFPGMSGGPVLDADGRVVGIHGRGFSQTIEDEEGDQDLLVKLELNLGIPINTFLKLAPEAGVNARVQVESSQPLENVRPDETLSISSQLPVKNPNTKTAKAVDLSNRGFDLLVMGRLQEALTVFEQANQIKPDFYPGWYGKGRALEALKREREALDALNKTLQLQPNFYYALLSQGYILRELKQYPDAIASYTKIIDHRPTERDEQDLHRFFQAKAYYMRGATRYDLEDPKGAIADYGKAIDTHRDFARAYYMRASVRLELGDKQGSIQDFQAAADSFLAQGNVEGYQKTRQLLGFLQR